MREMECRMRVVVHECTSARGDGLSTTVLQSEDEQRGPVGTGLRLSELET